MIDHQWTEDSATVPQHWSDAHLVLIRKPAKTGKEAGHYRPIGLQDQLGKLTFKALLEPRRDSIYAPITQYPQYGYTPGRSHRDALRRVFDHCSSVRAQCRAQHSTLHDKFAGITERHLVGGVQITLDLAAAFDTMPRHRLLEGTQRMQLPQSLVQIVMRWRMRANYHINHDGTDRIIHATQGVRQGCAVAPLLWLIFSHLVSDKLAEKIGYQATVDLLNIFADDYHCSGVFHSIWEIEQIEQICPASRCCLARLKKWECWSAPPRVKPFSNVQDQVQKCFAEGSSGKQLRGACYASAAPVAV